MEIFGGNRVLADQAMALAVSLMRKEQASATEIFAMLYQQVSGSAMSTPEEINHLQQWMKKTSEPEK